MGKFAVSIGVNYPSTSHALAGCVNDSHIIRSILMAKGFAPKNTIMLNDVDPDAQAPTGANVRKALDWLVTGRKDHDVVFIHFSGHGTQIPNDPSDADDVEVDGLDEAICLEDMFLFSDDDFKMHLSKLPKLCQATVLTDCCHSGGLLDHAEIAIGDDEDKDVRATNPRYLPREAPPSEARSLPVEAVASFLSSQLGGGTVAPSASGIAAAQAAFFGGDACKLAMKAAAAVAGSTGDNPLAAIMGGSACIGGGGGKLSGEALAAVGKNGVAGAVEGLGLKGVRSVTAEGAPVYVPTTQKLMPDTGILVTGCRSDQTSADVRPKGGKAHGALTDAVWTCYNRNPVMTNREMVLAVREELTAAGFSQIPQLECSAANADKIFICSDGNPAKESDQMFSKGGPDLSAKPDVKPGTPAAATPPNGSGGLSALFRSCFKA